MSAGPGGPMPGGPAMPPRPVLGAPPPPGMAPPPTPMATPGAMPPGMPPPPGGGMANGLGPSSPLGDLFTDLSTTMSPGWQILDIATRCLRMALKTPDMQKTPQVVAVLSSVLKTMTTLISHYTAGKNGVPTGLTDAGNSAGEGGETDSTASGDMGDEPADSGTGTGDAGSPFS